jgi:hypothetical protein
MMTVENFCRLAAAIFTLIALAQLTRALIGIQVVAGGMMVPVWPSWIAVMVFGGLAWLGFTARRG